MGRKEEIVFFTDEMIVHVKDPKELTKKNPKQKKTHLLELISIYFKVNIQKSIALLYTSRRRLVRAGQGQHQGWRPRLRLRPSRQRCAQDRVQVRGNR